MDTINNNQTLTLSLSGIIDSSNVARIEEKIMKQLDSETAENIVIDADRLVYISSAGLRMLLKVTKRFPMNVTMINVNTEIYEILQVTQFTSIINVRRRWREISAVGMQIIGQGATAVVYKIDNETIVKLYRNHDCLDKIEEEERRAKLAFFSGIPTAISYDIVKCDDHFGMIFELIDAKDCNALFLAHPEKQDDILKKYVAFIKDIHQVSFPHHDIPSMVDDYLQYLEDLHSYLPEALYVKLKSLLEEMPEDHHALHGDLQMKNVMISQGEPYLIDMATLSMGSYLFDLASLYVAYIAYGEDEADNTERFFNLTYPQCQAIWQKILTYYFTDLSDEELKETKARIQLIAYIRFLHHIAIRGFGQDYREIRITHTLEHLHDLASTIDRLI